MVNTWSPHSVAPTATPAASHERGAAPPSETRPPDPLPSDPTTLDLDQLMNVPLRASPQPNPEEALRNREPAAAATDLPPLEDLPADLTTMDLGDLMSLRAGTTAQSNEDEDDDDDADDEPSDPENDGEEPGEAQQLAADEPGAVVAAQAGEGEAAADEAQGDGDGGEGTDGAPPQNSGSDSGEADGDNLGQAIEILPAELVYAAALASSEAAPNAPPPQPVAAAPVARPEVAASPPVPNAAPVAGDDAAEIDGTASIVISVLANDRDPDGAFLRVTAVTQGGHGTVAINPDSTLTYTPEPKFAGVDSFTYTVSDGRGGTSSATVTITVTPPPPVNTAPVAQDDAAAGNEDTAIVINVLGNDRDADGDALHVTAVTQGQNGRVAVNGDGTLTYTPKADFFGTDAFTYTISDGRGGTSSATVSLIVKPVNDAPVAADDAVRTDQGLPVTFSVVANDVDADGDPLTVTAVTSGAHGKVAINTDGTLTYFPAAGFAGTDSFTYTVSDGQGGSAQATVEVTVNAVNAPPTADDSLAAMEAGTPISGTLTAADPDHTPADLTFSLATSPGNGTAIVHADGTYTYTPAAGFVGTDSFSFAVADPLGATAQATVKIEVVPTSGNTGTGGEFSVNTATAGIQQAPAMAALTGGGFVVAWESQNQDGSGFGIFAQRFDATGDPVGPEFRANTFVLNHQNQPSVTALNDGGFVLTWHSRDQDGSDLGIFGKRFDANGQASPEFQVNTFAKGVQEASSVAGLADGGFVVVWQSQNQDGNNMGVFAQRFDSAARPAGGEFQVNTVSQFAQQAPDVAALAGGGFVVVWESQNQDGNNMGVFGQRFSATGQAIGSEFQVNTFTQFAQQAPDVAALADGGYVVVWQSQNQDGSTLGIFGQRFAADGSAVDGEFQVNTQTRGFQQSPAVAADADGGFTVVWQSDGQDGSGFGVFAQRYDAGGAAVGPEFQVNEFTPGFQGSADVALLANGGLATTWQSFGQDGAADGIFGRIFDTAKPTGHAFTGGAGNDSFIGGDLADTLSGGDGSDRLDGRLGADQLFGGSGDDILLWDPADAVIDGGTGHDTLRVGGGDMDLTAFAGKMSGIEAVDLATDTGNNHLILRAEDILDVSDTNTLSVLGDGGDSLAAGRGWTHAGNDGQGNDIYAQFVGGVSVTLIVDSDITLNADLLL